MATGLIIPGVQVTVVKEVLPQQLAPSGVLGITGFTEVNPGKVVRAGSWSRFVEVMGRASAYSLPEARQALDNGVSELVISPLPASAGLSATIPLPGDATKAPNGTTAEKSGFTLTARAPGPWANGITVKVEYRNNIDKSVSFDVEVTHPASGATEVFRNLAPGALAAGLDGGSSFVKVDASKTVGWPTAGTYTLAGGKDGSASDYATALNRLRNEPDVDMVLAALQDFGDRTKVTSVYGDVISHCNSLSGDSKGRLGFGQIPPTGTTDEHVQLASNLVSDRFVLVAPNGVVGAVAGLVGSLPAHQSPTFKRVSGVGELPALTVEDQKAFLRGYVVPVVTERGRGTIVVRGLTTDGDQINVRRVADRAVRTLKMIGDLFIGLLNNADGRSALKQKLVEALVQMEKDGAIVPSTDGKDPAFKVEVYSSQQDFALGIVRVNMAVRPVRAIDYIYATITVQV
ncbi:phage tail sheath C-terminal domain-containing protein [Pyxidicoccus trucidator]|uniref:phage tail sheath C-terminal domain-containing protein n=1 Tax=Pyxidicoccus trucidator TaxID=2709662 RepID=UPI0013DA6742|nr:phage tail sheath C-terminal domain-containing protein [Pyxidicoccus trucidator]